MEETVGADSLICDSHKAERGKKKMIAREEMNKGR